jgi:hypothetical protein
MSERMKQYRNVTIYRNVTFQEEFVYRDVS